MGFVHFNEKHQFVGRDGKPFYLIGSNFSGGYICSDFWSDWRPDRLKRDLDIMRDMGFNGIRIPIVWKTVEPAEGRYDEKILQRIGQYFTWCAERGIYVMPWCLAGVATMNYDVPWRFGRAILSDPDMIRAEENHLAMLGERFKNYENLLCWDICDEPEWFSRLLPGNDQLPYNADKITKWVGRMANAFRRGDPNHMVTLGFGHIATGRYGMDLRDCAEQLDFMAVTAYAGLHGGNLNNPRPGYELQYHMDINRRNGPCYFCEAPGWSQARTAEKAIGHYYNAALYSGLLHHSSGVLPWVFSDFDEAACLVEDKPYTTDGTNRHPIEPMFGMLDENRNIRDCGQRMVDFKHETDKVNITKYRYRQENTALIVPHGYHSASWTEVSRMIAGHALISASNLTPKMVWWDEVDPQKLPFAVMSSVTEGGSDSVKYKTEDWKRFSNFVEDGGTLVMLRTGPSIYFNKMAGAWLNDSVKKPNLGKMRITRDFGPYKAGDEIMLDTAANSRHSLVVDGAEVLATFEDGEPAIITHAFGKGRTYVFAIDCITRMDDCTEEEWHRSPLFALLQAMAEKAGIIPEAACDDPGIEAGVLHGDDSDLLVVFNHNANHVDADIVLRGAHDQTVRLSLDGGEGRMIPLPKAK